MDQEKLGGIPVEPHDALTNSAAGTTEKDQQGRLEKFGLAHLDRAQTLSAGATKAALAWSAALALIWFQVLEPKLTQVRAALRSEKAVDTISQLRPEEVGAAAYAGKLNE